jgi:hypothetical protein
MRRKPINLPSIINAGFNDINESKENNSLCLGGRYINPIGSFKCACPNGYAFDAPKIICRGKFFQQKQKKETFT